MKASAAAPPDHPPWRLPPGLARAYTCQASVFRPQIAAPPSTAKMAATTKEVNFNLPSQHTQTLTQTDHRLKFERKSAGYIAEGGLVPMLSEEHLVTEHRKPSKIFFK